MKNPETGEWEQIPAIGGGTEQGGERWVKTHEETLKEEVEYIELQFEKPIKKCVLYIYSPIVDTNSNLRICMDSSFYDVRSLGITGVPSTAAKYARYYIEKGLKIPNSSNVYGFGGVLASWYSLTQINYAACSIVGDFTSLFIKRGSGQLPVGFYVACEAVYEEDNA